MNCQEDLFSLPSDIHYLNCAFMSPLMKKVTEAGIEGIRRKEQPWQIGPEHFFEESKKLRELFAKLIHGSDHSSIALLPSVSYGMSTVAKNLPDVKRGKIIVVGEQFPSNVYPWMRFCRETGCRLQVVDAPGESEAKAGERGKVWNQRILEAIDDHTLMVALGHVHWTDGTLYQLEEIGRRAREVDAYLVIDGTQSVGALPFDLEKIRPDALICAGYKWLLGPYSIALSYFGERFRQGIPLEEGWLEREGSENFAGLVNYTDEYQQGAIRYDVGESSNFILVPMMIAALKQLLSWGPGNIQEYCRKLTASTVTRLEEVGFQIAPSHRRSHHLFGIRLPAGIDPEMIQQKMAEKNVHVSIRGSSLRISPHVYNDESDLNPLVDVLTKQIVM